MYDKLKDWAKANGFILKDKIDWNWDRYGDGIPSVTTILQLLVEPSFEYVKRRYASEVKIACEKGTKIHGDAEDFFNGDSEQIHKQIMKFHVLYDVNIIGKEVKIFANGFQGTIDLVGVLHDQPIKIFHTLESVYSKTFNVDYKSSMNESKKYFLQLMGYKEGNGNDGAILYLNDKKFKLVFVPPEYMELWIELREYFFTLLKQGQ